VSGILHVGYFPTRCRDNARQTVKWNVGIVERWNGGTVERWNGESVDRQPDRRATEDAMFRKIIIPLDGSRSAEEALGR